MKTVVNISMVLVLLLSSTVLAAKQKKQKQPPAESKKTEVQVSAPAPVAETNVPAEANAAAVNIEPKSSGKVTATVGDKKITEDEVEKAMAPRMQQMAGRVPDNMIPQYRQQIRKRVIEQLVVEELVTQEEKKSNISISDAELAEQINKQIAEQNLSLDEFKSLLKAYGTTYGEYEQNIRKRLMFEKLMEIQFKDKLPKSTDEQLKAYYEQNIQQFQKPEAIHAKHILVVPTKDVNDPNQAMAQAKKKAENILKMIKKGGSFEELAKLNSDCPSGKNGGDLGVQPKGSLVPDFEKAAYALKPGEVSDVIQTEFGYHVIKLVAHIDANTVSFEQAKDEIKESLTGKQKEQIVMEYIQKIRAGADVKYTDESDKLEMGIPGMRQAPPSRKPAESVQPSDESKQTPKDSEKPKKD